MEHFYITEDGFYFDLDDFTDFARWKIQDLQDQSWSNDDILNFDNSTLWHDFVEKMNQKIE
jgi:hypothetical protein